MRATFIRTVTTQYEPEQLAFVDESASDQRTTFRNRGWALSGMRAVRKTVFVRGDRYV